MSSRNTSGMTPDTLKSENKTYHNTNGISPNNHNAVMSPGFLNTNTGNSVPSRFADGHPAPIHSLDGLPTHWILERDKNGHVRKTIAGILAGFILNGHFLTRQEAICQTRMITPE